MSNENIRAILWKMRTHSAYGAAPELLRQAERDGLVYQAPDAIGDGTHYALTDAGRAEARVGEDRGELTVDGARRERTADLRQVWGDHPIAQRQLELRERGGARVRGVLVACGEQHSGTGGWQVVPHVTPEHRIGYVDVARGRAYLTNAELDAETVEALTVPGQEPGTHASGAAAWGAPDAGQGASTETPDGWSQLLSDVRTNVGDVDEVEGVHVELVAFGLVTCYSHRRGDPPEARVSEWPLTDEQRARIQAMAAEFLEDLHGQIPEAPDPGSWPLDRDVKELKTALNDLPIGDGPPDRGTVPRALHDHDLNWAGDAADAYAVTYTRGRVARDAVHAALRNWAVDRLTPMVKALPEELGPYNGDGLRHQRRKGVVRAASERLLNDLLLRLLRTRAGRTTVQELYDRCCEVLYEDGAIVTPYGRRQGVTCTRPPAKPEAERREIQGIELYRVPFGADRPEGFDHVVKMSISDELVCRPEDAERASAALLGIRPTPEYGA